MNKDLKKLYDYCKSQGYEGSTEEFEQELKSLIVEEIDSKELLNVAGGNKQTKAAVAGLFSALSIASPFASAAQNIKSNNKTVNSNFKVQNGINQLQKNKKMLKDILLKGVLPVGTLVVGTPALVGTGIFIKNKIADNNLNDKTRRFLAQLLADSFDYCANYCENVLLEEKKRIAEKTTSYKKIKDLETANTVCNHIIFNDESNHSWDSIDHLSNYSQLREFVNSGQVEENNGNFSINDAIKCRFMFFHRIFVDKRAKIVSPECIYNDYLKGNTKLINQITKDQYVQSSMKNLERAINDLKQSVEDSPITHPNDVGQTNQKPAEQKEGKIEEVDPETATTKKQAHIKELKTKMVKDLDDSRKLDAIRTCLESYKTKQPSRNVLSLFCTEKTLYGDAHKEFRKNLNHAIDSVLEYAQRCLFQARLRLSSNRKRPSTYTYDEKLQKKLNRIYELNYVQSFQAFIQQHYSEDYKRLDENVIDQNRKLVYCSILEQHLNEYIETIKYSFEEIAEKYVEQVYN